MNLNIVKRISLIALCTLNFGISVLMAPLKQEIASSVSKSFSILILKKELQFPSILNCRAGLASIFSLNILLKNLLYFLQFFSKYLIYLSCFSSPSRIIKVLKLIVFSNYSVNEKYLRQVKASYCTLSP